MSEKKNIFDDAKEKITQTAQFVGDKAGVAKEMISEGTIRLVDENGNGQIDLEDFVVKALRTPGIHVNRTEYLSNAFRKYCNEETINNAIATTPAKAGISRTIADKAANESINLQKTLAAATSLGLGAAPGGLAVDLATTVTDLGQFYGHLLVIMQKLMYLYGYPELDLTKNQAGIDDGTMNLIIIGIGTMAGVEAACKFMNKLSVMLANNVPKILLRGVLAEKVAFQVTKDVCAYFGVRLTRELAKKGIGNSIKVFGGIIVGSITFVSFSSSCKNFQKIISNSPLSDPNYICSSAIIDAEFTTVEDVEKEFEKDIRIQDTSQIN